MTPVPSLARWAEILTPYRDPLTIPRAAVEGLGDERP